MCRDEMIDAVVVEVVSKFRRGGGDVFNVKYADKWGQGTTELIFDASLNMTIMIGYRFKY